MFEARIIWKYDSEVKIYFNDLNCDKIAKNFLLNMVDKNDI